LESRPNCGRISDAAESAKNNAGHDGAAYIGRLELNAFTIRYDSVGFGGAVYANRRRREK